MWVGGQTDLFSEKRFSERVRLITVLFALGYSVICLRLFYLQVLKGSDLEQISESNRTQVIFLRAPRGNLYDRAGRLFVSNRPSWSLMYSSPDKSPEVGKRSIDLLNPFLQTFPAHWKSRLTRAVRTGQMVRLVEDVPSDISFGIRELGELIPGLRVVMEFRRGYPENAVGGHILGYLGEIDEGELKDKQWVQRKQGDMIGKMGIERVLDAQLRGHDGGMLIEVDSIGRLKRIIKELSSQKGSDVYLTLDAKIQEAAQQGLAETDTQRGAAVAIDVNTGAILAWVSSPSFDEASNLTQHRLDERRPFFDRVYKGAYPPGSVFKILTAIAGFEKGSIRTSETVNCIGYVTLPDKRGTERRFGCWKRHGVVDYWRAMAESCNTYFYQLGGKIGSDSIYNTAYQFGLSQPTQKFMAGENSGMLLNAPLKRKRKLGGWSTGDTYNMSIGQGYTTSTPLQIAVMMAGVATKGTEMTPYLLDKIINPDGSTSQKTEPSVLRTITLQDSTWKAIFDSLRMVVTSGTAQMCNVPYLEVRAKTGTAQNPHGEEHAWLASFAGYPGERSSIAVVVFVENGGHGGAAAGPVARKMIEAALPPRQALAA